MTGRLPLDTDTAGPVPGGRAVGPFSSYPPHVPGAGLCYVRGCQDGTDPEPAIHRDFGPVITCARHQPTRGDRGPRPVPAPTPDAQDVSQGADDIDGGTRVLARPTPPTTPPSDGAALVPGLPAGVRPF